MNQIFAPQPTASQPIAAVGEIDAGHDLLVARARAVAEAARVHAALLDEDGAFPSQDICALADNGLLVAPLPRHCGGADLGLRAYTTLVLAQILAIIGWGGLPLGRLYEGHVNALKLIGTYGNAAQLAHFASLVRAGHMFAVWNTEAADGLRLINRNGTRRLEGRKIFASGACHVVHPLVTARDEAGALVMIIPDVAEQSRGDLSDWTAHGMRASASGAVDFTGIVVADHQLIGGDDDFHRQPMFSTGAWRFAAVQTGGIAAVFDAARAHLVKVGRADDPHQRARMGQAALAVQSARQWVIEAALLADDAALDADRRIAHVNLARTAVERAGLDVLELAQRSVGLAGFSRKHPLERLSRDLATYLRQPNPDKALGDAAAHVLTSTEPALDLWPWA